MAGMGETTLARKEALVATGCRCVWRTREHEEERVNEDGGDRYLYGWIGWSIKTWSTNCPYVSVSDGGQARSHPL
jgi:hypothetical protein